MKNWKEIPLNAESGRNPASFLKVAFLTILALLTVFPFYWVGVLSTHGNSTIFSTPPPFLPGDQLGANYDALMEMLPFWTIVGNSLIVATVGTVISLLFCSMGGYAFAVYRFRFKKLLFVVLITTMMIPPIINLIPFYLTINFLGLMDTLTALWLPFTVTPFGVFLIRQYTASSIPGEIVEAARLEGAGEFRIFFTVVLPLLGPALATLGIVQFIFFWNNFLMPLVVISSREKYTITLALRSIQGMMNQPWGAVMLGTFITLIPLLIVFLFASRRMMTGLTAGAVKS